MGTLRVCNRGDQTAAPTSSRLRLIAIRCFNLREKAVAAPRPRRGRGAGTAAAVNGWGESDTS